MKVVWSDYAVWALVTLETRLAQRYSSDKAARIVEELVHRVDRLEGPYDVRNRREINRSARHIATVGWIV
jgi:hypothetical protein